ncbi:helix-turn-helix domain-containing protein [Streptococcus cameli]
MNQEKIGLFLKELRLENGLTQEQFAEDFAVSNRTVSRWENGVHLPDLGLLIAIAQFYNVSINELIDGERKSEMKSNEFDTTIEKVAAYADQDKRTYRYRIRKTVGYGFILFGFFLIITFLTMMPADSSWGSFYSVIGTLFISIGITYILAMTQFWKRILLSISAFVVIMAVLLYADYLGVKHQNQVPRFVHSKIYYGGSDYIIYESFFYTALYHIETKDVKIVDAQEIEMYDPKEDK